MISAFLFISCAVAGPIRLRGIGNITHYDEWDEFYQYQSMFRKSYDTREEMMLRFRIFTDNLYDIMQHNANETNTFKMKVNQFTDLSPSEFKAQYVTGWRSVESYGCKTYESSNSDVPNSIDWREKNAVTSVKDQGQCGSCWTFSSTGAVEGAWAIATGNLEDLSEQQLVDCATGAAYGSHGCNGGQMEGAFKYVIRNGQCLNASYPYSAKDGECKPCNEIVHISACFDVKPNDQISLQSAVSRQPVAIAIEADTRYFQSYSSGVLTSVNCGTNLDHGVLIVGYGTENGNDYYLVKNSWGESWGEKGYVKIGRSLSANDPGICGIAMDPSFPVV